MHMIPWAAAIFWATQEPSAEAVRKPERNFAMYKTLYIAPSLEVFQKSSGNTSEEVNG